MSHLAEEGALPMACSGNCPIIPAAHSAFICDLDHGSGVLSSSGALSTGSPPSAIVPMEALLGAAADVVEQDATFLSWPQEVDSTTPALDDRSSASASQRRASAESLSLSNSSDGSPTCRICFFGDAKQPLLEPCNCRGTIGFVHRDCLERWIQRTVDPQCQVCHFHFTVRKQAEPAWRLLFDVEARRPVLGYVVLGALFALSIAFIFTLAWLYAVCLPSRVGDKLAATVVVLLAVQNILWLYFPFVSFTYSYKAFKKWHEDSTCLKLVLSTDETSGAAWSNLRFWRTGGGSRDPVLSCGGAQ
ncbi:E3 ubiquitin-protein ligase MARCHF3-like isoform X2 [Dermacentor andersoni]|uniref:E3 ubiquitin-protein ligase MARCHF3-like isoform X2 n=1 Tax=Dermacentor andersoni TaxID=34620 RepID=UPI002155406D|nr:E3 ubiquitin-protein ligase MARCHF2-like isoform X2 [Dermacentor andersoni]